MKGCVCANDDTCRVTNKLQATGRDVPASVKQLTYRLDCFAHTTWWAQGAIPKSHTRCTSDLLPLIRPDVGIRTTYQAEWSSWNPLNKDSEKGHRASDSQSLHPNYKISETVPDVCRNKITRTLTDMSHCNKR